MKILSERRGLILKELVDEYVSLGKPVGSKYLSKKVNLKISAATIRNELAYLESQGYLTHIFTSSGRMPTDKGYRYYVDFLLDKNRLSLEQRRKIFSYFRNLDAELNEVFKTSTNLIAKLTSCIGLATTTGNSENKIKHIDIVPLSLEEILVVLISERGFIGKRRLKASTIDNDINYLEKFLNTNFTKLNYKQFQVKVRNVVALLSKNKTFSEICEAVTDILKKQQQQELFYEGTNYLVDYPEVSDPNHFKTAVAFLDKSDFLKPLYNQLYSLPYVVSIGCENEQIIDFALIASGVMFNDKLIGAVGMLGPKRIDYNNAISTVCCVASNISNCTTN